MAERNSEVNQDQGITTEDEGITTEDGRIISNESVKEISRGGSWTPKNTKKRNIPRVTSPELVQCEPKKNGLKNQGQKLQKLFIVPGWELETRSVFLLSKNKLKPSMN